MSEPPSQDNEPLLAPDEEKLLTALGYLVMRWNYAENFARAILRKNLPDESLLDKPHMQISARGGAGIEEDLEKLALPNWQEPGRTFLERFIEAYSSGCKHRNSIVHGIYSTTPQRGEFPARAILIFEKPRAGKLFWPADIELEKLLATANHFHDLAMFAREISIAFDATGAIARNKDGTAVLPILPTLISPLPEVERFQIEG